MLNKQAELEEAVQRGAKWLDSNKPGWAAKVSLDTLKTNDTCNCVLAQLSGLHYDDAIAEQGQNPYGKWASAKGWAPSTMNEGLILDDLWKKVIEYRKGSYAT